MVLIDELVSAIARQTVSINRIVEEEDKTHFNAVVEEFLICYGEKIGKERRRGGRKRENLGICTLAKAGVWVGDGCVYVFTPPLRHCFVRNRDVHTK
jgi:hypothetical protein